jgi:gamma-glutamylcysteine synthetase
MSITAKLLDTANSTQHFSAACQKAKDQLTTKEQFLLSEQILVEMIANQESYVDFVNRLSLQHQKDFLQTPLPIRVKEEFEHVAAQSLQKQVDLERKDRVNLDTYISQYLEN